MGEKIPPKMLNESVIANFCSSIFPIVSCPFCENCRLEWDSLKKVVVDMQKWKRPNDNRWYDYVEKLCCYEIVSQVRLKEQRLNPLTRWGIQVTGEEVRYWFPESLGPWEISTLWNFFHQVVSVWLVQDTALYGSNYFISAVYIHNILKAFL